MTVLFVNMMNPWIISILLVFQIVLPLWGESETHYMRQLHSVAEIEKVAVRNPVQAADGFVWFVSEKGIGRFDGYRIVYFSCSDSVMATVCKAKTLDLCPDLENHLLWIHTEDGFIGSLNWLNGHFVSAPSATRGNYKKCHHGKVYHWLYCSDRGCCRVRYVNGAFEVEQYPHKIKEIQTDESDNDWILTDAGLFRNGFDKVLPSSKGIEHIALYRSLCLGVGQKHLLIYNRSRQIVRNTPLPASFQSLVQELDLRVQDEILWIYAGASVYSYQMVDGIFEIHPSVNSEGECLDSLFADKQYKRGFGTVVSQIVVDGRTIISPYDWVELPSSSNRIEVGVTNFNFQPEGEGVYQFFLEEIDSGWSVPSSSPVAVYENLPAGDYRFHVRASLDGQHWSSEGICIFSIATPWWQKITVWLIIGAIVLLGVCVCLMLRYVKRTKANRQFGKGKESLSLLNGEDEPRKIAVPWHQMKLDEYQQFAEKKEKSSFLKDERFKLLLEDAISQHITDPHFAMDDLAMKLGIGRTRFYIRTKEVMGCSPAELLRNRRFEYAAKLLRSTDLTIDEIRKTCCFSNSSNFYNSFKQRYGVTPYQYRTLIEVES